MKGNIKPQYGFFHIYNYYGKDNSLIEVIDSDDDNLVCINLQKLYILILLVL